ncbi:MAG TPA: tetratricopeptide repeat protein, partial [Polyangiales bacterium]
MRRTVYGLSCFVMVFGVNAVASADADYYRAFARADAAVKAGDCDAAIAVIEQALRKYPRDYALTLKLAWVEFQRGQYAAAERTYRAASTLSDGSVEARIGIGWSLIQEDRCDDARRVLHDVLSESDEESARRGLEACTERERVHGSVWAGLGGSLYQHHPWMHLSGDAYAGLDLVPIEGLELSAQYRFLDLEATDRRVPGFTQHEVYAQAGYTSKELDILGQGAVVWSGDAVVGGSRHVGASLRRKYFGALPGNVFVEVSGSYYADLWVVRLAPSWTVTFDPISLTAGVAIEQFAHDTLASASLTA